MADRESFMPNGYVALLLDINDLDRYADYLSKAAVTVKAHGGVFLFASEHPHVVEGAWPAQRTIIIEFPSVEAANAWYVSREYEPLIKDRRATADSRVAIFGGIERE
jgi:uncharacterized protein (DUF1330 family)